MTGLQSEDYDVSSPYNTALIFVVSLHVEVTVVSDGEDVRRHLSDLLVGVEPNLICCIDGQKLIGVHRH